MTRCSGTWTLIRQDRGWSLGELLVGVGIVGLLASLGWRGGSEALARQRLEVAIRRLDQGIQRGRAEAKKTFLMHGCRVRVFDNKRQCHSRL